MDKANMKPLKDGDIPKDGMKSLDVTDIDQVSGGDVSTGCLLFEGGREVNRSPDGLKTPPKLILKYNTGSKNDLEEIR